MSDWSPEQYNRFQAERSQPAYDLMDMISPRNQMRTVDLGCGTGEHTKTLHERFRAVETIGIDSSEEMLMKAPRAPGLKFYRADIREFGGESEFDLIYSNAALHWVPEHEIILGRVHRALRPGGQVAIQVPSNYAHPSHRMAFELEREPPYNQYPPCPTAANTLAPEGYAQALHRIGYRSIKVRLFVYLHELSSGGDTVEWLKGSFLNHYRATQPPEVYSLFEQEFTNRIEREIGQLSPYLFTFNRILFHAVR